MSRNKKTIYLILYLLIYIGILQKYFFSNLFLPVLPDILIFAVALWGTCKKSDKVIFLKFIGKPLCAVYILLILCSVLGAIFNGIVMPSYLWGLRVLIRYALLVWIIYLHFNIVDAEKYKRILYQSYNVNLLVCVFQFFKGERGDAMSGTFTGNGSLMLFCLLVFLIATADYFYGLIRLKKLLYIVSVLMLVAIWAEIKMMYFLFPLVFYSMYVFIRKFNFKLILLVALGFYFLIPAMQFFMSFYYGEDYVQQTFDTEFIEKETSHAYGFQEGGFNRSTAIEDTDRYLLDTPTSKFFGHGLGSGSLSSIFSTGYSLKYAYTSFWNFSTSYCLVEMGWIGFVLYALFFVFIIWQFFSYNIKATDSYVKYWSAIGIVSGLCTYFIAWYNDCVYFKYLPMYYLWGICLVAIARRKRKTKNIN